MSINKFLSSLSSSSIILRVNFLCLLHGLRNFLKYLLHLNWQWNSSICFLFWQFPDNHEFIIGGFTCMILAQLPCCTYWNIFLTIKLDGYLLPYHRWIRIVPAKEIDESFPFQFHQFASGTVKFFPEFFVHRIS